RDGDPHILQADGALGGRDDDLFERQRRPLGPGPAARCRNQGAEAAAEKQGAAFLLNLPGHHVLPLLLMSSATDWHFPRGGSFAGLTVFYAIMFSRAPLRARRMRSAALSAIMMTGALVLPVGITGMTDAS